MKKIFLVFILLMIFSLPARAEENPYAEQYKASGAEEIKDSLPHETKDFFAEFKLDPEDPDWVNKVNAKSIFSHIGSFLKEGGRGPLRAAATMVGVTVLFAAAGLMEKMREYKSLLSYLYTLVSAAGVLLPLFSLIAAVQSAIRGMAAFMTSFVPIYAGILTVGGRPLTASGMSFLLLFAAEAVNLIAAFVMIPLMGAYLGMGLIGGIMAGNGAVGLGEMVKKASTWLFSLSVTVFLGLLSIQTAVNASAESAGLRTVKFVLGSLVPVTGGAISESLNTLTASMKLLSSSVGMYAVLALAVVALPVILELLLWRLALYFTSAVSELFGIREGVGLFKCADHVLSTLVGIILFTACLFIISLAVVTNS